MKPATDAKVWAFLVTARPTSGIARSDHSGFSREARQSDLVVNCNLQRLDGPVRGNGQIIQELELPFRARAGTSSRFLWGSEWIPFSNATPKDCW